jgi:repressor LexA
MKGLCNFADERAGRLFTVKNIIQIDRIDAKPEGKLVEGKRLFSTGFFYNISYGLVNTHREYYTQFCTKVKGYGGISMQHCTSEGAGKIHERLKYLRKTLGLSQEEFGGRIGKSLRTIQYWETGKVQIPDTTLKLISQVFGVSYEWLKEGKGEMWVRKDKALLEGVGARLIEIAERLVRIPIVGGVGVGFPKSSAEINMVGYILVSKETLQKGGRFAVQVRGDSMEPTLHGGDFVVFKPYVGDVLDIPNGKIVVVRKLGGELIVKRLTRINGIMMLTSDNPKYPPILPQQIEEEEELQIVGIAVEAIKRIEL